MRVGMHADPLDMVAYVRGSLSDARAAEVRKHCFACRDCGDQLAAVLILRGATPARASAPWYASRLVAAAAGVVLLIGAVAWFASGGVVAGPPGLMDNSSAAASDGSASSLHGAGGFAALTAADVEIINMIPPLLENQLKRLEVAVEVDSEAANTMSALQAGVGALADGDYGVAAGYLGRFGVSYHPTGTYLLGLALFFDGRRLPDAQRTLEAHLSTLSDPERVDWGTADRTAAYYLARVHLEAGQLDPALRLLRRAALPPASDPGDVGDLDRVHRAARQLLLDLE